MNNLLSDTKLKSTVEKHIKITNQKIETLEGSSGKMFDAVKAAITAFNNDKKAVKLYKGSLNGNHRSTISMMIRVARNELIRQNESKLPTSYQTLNELIKLINELEKTDNSSFEMLVEEGQIHSQMSKADVANLLKVIKEQNTLTAYKTVDLEEEIYIKCIDENEIKFVKIPDVEQLEEFVSKLDYERRQRLIELLRLTNNEVKEAA